MTEIITVDGKIPTVDGKAIIQPRIADGIVVKARDVNGYATEIDFFGTSIKSDQISSPTFKNLQKINFKNAVTSVVGHYGITGTKITELSLPDLTTYETEYAFENNKSLTRAFLPKLTFISSGDWSALFRGCSALQEVQLGSVGNGITFIDDDTFYGVNNQGMVATLYTIGSTVDGVLANARAYAPNITIIIKASEDTTYNDETYLAGETILTSTPT